ncbi:fused MFS/spermidine synthase [Thiomicrospira sp.]|uniref:fused MFS/spermidine synthase n=1 Tax=Thiomicrospira sp. TaxID=935 RepID=UPI002F952244
MINPFRFSRQTPSPKPRYGGEIIHAERDEYGLIQVIDTQICRSLHFDSAVKQSRYFFQAPLSLAFEYQQVLEQKIADFSYQKPLKNLLMLGVGGGSLASKLFISEPKLQMTLVDLRQSVIDIAHDFFHLPFHKNIQTLAQDAAEFIQHNDQAYDVIVVDVFNENGMPDAFCQAAFLNQLVEQVKAPGLVLFNLWQSTPEPTLKVIQFFESQGPIELFPIHSSKNLILQYQAR